jgi:hypothetical protein
VELNFRPTFIRPVDIGIEPPFGAHDQFLHVFSLSCSSFFLAPLISRYYYINPALPRTLLQLKLVGIITINLFLT